MLQIQYRVFAVRESIRGGCINPAGAIPLSFFRPVNLPGYSPMRHIVQLRVFIIRQIHKITDIKAIITIGSACIDDPYSISYKINAVKPCAGVNGNMPISIRLQCHGFHNKISTVKIRIFAVLAFGMLIIVQTVT